MPRAYGMLGVQGYFSETAKVPAVCQVSTVGAFGLKPGAP